MDQAARWFNERIARGETTQMREFARVLAEQERQRADELARRARLAGRLGLG